jgi:1-acyl-sn-glycerol-3-phosphate acyltransferase
MTRSYRAIAAFFRGLLHVFFRQVRVAGLENVPAEGGGLIVAWHPNALLDPALILTTLPRRVVFGARSGLFRVPLLGRVMRALGTVPLHRGRDARPGARGEAADAARREANRGSVDALARAVADGSFSALFPEGHSHDEPDVQELKSGAASLFYRAVELTPPGQPPPVILPVGLHYDEKGAFGSKALVAFHPPLELPPELAAPPPRDASPEERRERYRRLTGRVDEVLRESVYGVETWHLHHLMHRARKLVRAERAARAGAAPGRTDIEERVLGFARLWTGYRQLLARNPDEVRALQARVERYDDDLRALRLEDHELDAEPAFAAFWPTLLLVLQVAVVYLLLPPVLVIGYLVNLPTALGLIGLAKVSSEAYKDEATVKLLGGAVAFPLTWLVVALAVAWGERHLAALYPQVVDAPLVTGVLAFLLSAASGVVALVYWRLARQTLRAVRVRFTRRRRRAAVARLRRERGALHDAIVELSGGLDLPGSVSEDGRVVRQAPAAMAPRPAQ